MKYSYIVNKNGVYYPAGTEVPEDKVTNEDGKANGTDEKPYTKTDINRMAVAELQTLAAEQGIEGAGEMNGADLKKALIEKFGL